MAGERTGLIGLEGRPFHVTVDSCPVKGGFSSRQPLGTNEQGISGARLIGWPRKITWDEFTQLAAPPVGEYPHGVDPAAETRVGWKTSDYIPHVLEQGQWRLGAFTLSLRIQSDSWVVKDQMNETLLRHEQGHFDIIGLVARDLLKAWGALRASTNENVDRDFWRIYKVYRAHAVLLSKQQYENDTNYGRNPKSQSDWESRIKACIQQGASLGTPPP